MRLDHKMSQKYVSKKLNISQQYYASIESGERQKNLKLPLVIKISELFNIPIDFIIDKENER